MKEPKTFLYLEIAESIRRHIVSGDLSPNDRLPAIRDMACRWGCTPGTVSRAYAQLAREGLVVGRRGGGTRVASGALDLEPSAWQWATLINKAEQYLLAAIGDGNTLAQAESALSVAVSRWRDVQRAELPASRSENTGVASSLRFAGSHDLAVEILARLVFEEMPELRLSVEYVGSLGGLMALARNEAQIAGTHLWDNTSDTYNLPFVQRLLPGRQTALLTIAHRSLGFIVPPGNPQGLEDLADLARPGVSLVNRQPGSGTRVWLDAQLKALGIPAESVAGYEREELTHLAVARAVSEREATVGLGIYAAAAAYGLGFVPLATERYDLVLPEPVWSSPPAQALVAGVRSAHFKEAVAALGGYDTSETGREAWIA